MRTRFIAVLAAASFSVSAQAAEFINVLTGGTSGVYYPMGVALSQIYGKVLPDAKTSVQATKSLIHRARLTLRQRLRPYLATGHWDPGTDGTDGPPTAA